MRYMLIMRSTPEAEKAMQNVDFNEVIAAMGRYNESLTKAGVLLAGEGLAGPDEGFVVDFASDPPVVTDGPYTEGKEHVGGVVIIAVPDLDGALEWARKTARATTLPIEVRPFQDHPTD